MFSSARVGRFLREPLLCAAVIALSLVIMASPALAAPSSTRLSDYDGHAFVTNPAPVLRFERKAKPSLTGIDYEFNEQTAQGVALLSRFPAFKLSDRRIHVDGPWYDSDEANLHFSRGIASIGAIPRYREKADAPTNLRKVPFSNLEGRHVWLRGTDMLGVQRTWRGDWRAAADNTTPTLSDTP
jgi:hypothetical protein